MAEKKYLDFAGLDRYDNKIKGVISAGDEATLVAAKGYADGLAGNYDAAGSAATAESNAKSYTDGQISTVNGTIAGVKTIAEQGVVDAATAQAAAEAAQAAADAAQGEVDALETLVGVLPEGTTVTNVVAYVDKKTEGIASEGAMTELAGRVTVAEGKITALENDHLVAADKEELEGKISDAQAAADAVQGEMDAFKAAAEIGDAAIDTLKEIQTYIESDLAAADKMTKDIAANAKAVEDEAAARAEAIADAVEALEGADAAQVERIAALEAKFTGDDSVADQIADAVAAEAELRVAADNALDGKIATAQGAADKAQDEVDALEGVVEALTGVVNGKVAQGDHDALAGRVTTAEGKITTLEGASHTHDNKAVLDGITAQLISNWNDAHSKAHVHANAEVLDGITNTLVESWSNAEGNAKAYTDEKIAEFFFISNDEIDGLFQ